MQKTEQETVSGPNRSLDEALRPNPGGTTAPGRGHGGKPLREEDIQVTREEDVKGRHESGM